MPEGGSVPTRDRRSTSLPSPGKLQNKPEETEEVETSAKTADSKGLAGQRKAKADTWAAAGTEVSGKWKA